MALGVAAHSAEIPDTNDALQEIVVTAEKRSSTVLETPISMSALSGEELVAKGLLSVEDLAGAVPGISMRTAGPGQTEYEMRGLSSAGGSTATVGFYLDEVPLSASAVGQNGRTVIDPELFDLSHVEVLRGPQGTLYGAGSMGGTIKLVTNAPQPGAFDAAAYLSSSDTKHGSVNGAGSGMLNLPMGEIAALRLVATERYVSGWIDRIVIAPGKFPAPTNPAPATSPYGACLNYYCTRGDVEDAPVQTDVKGSNLERFSSARAAFLVKPTDGLSITTTLMYQRIDADGYNNDQSPPGGLAIYQPYNLPEPYYDSFKLASLVLDYDFGLATLTSATSYWRRFVYQSTDSTEALQNIFNTTDFIENLYVEEDPTTQVSQELRLVSNAQGAFQWVAGLYAADLHSGYVTFNQTPTYANAMTCTPSGPTAGSCGPGGVLVNVNNGGAAANPNGIIFNDNNLNVMKQSAIFGEASYKFTQFLKLTAGLRFFRFDVHQISNSCGVGTQTGNASCVDAAVAGSGTNVLPKLNLAYTPDEDLTVYGTVSKGSRPGGVNIPIPLPTTPQLEANPSAYNCGLPLANRLNPSLPIPPGLVYVTSQPSYFAPDSVVSYEVGEKSRFAERRISFNADLFYVKWTNIQQALAVTCGYLLNEDVGNGRSYGPEAELSATVAPGLNVDLSAAYTNAEVTEPKPHTGVTAGTLIDNVPKYTGTAALNYERVVAEGYKARFRLAASMVGPMDDVAYYRETLPSHTFLDGRAGITRGKWVISLFGTNLTNRIAPLTINNTTFAWQQPTITRVTLPQPRTIGVDANVAF